MKKKIIILNLIVCFLFSIFVFKPKAYESKENDYAYSTYVSEYENYHFSYKNVELFGNCNNSDEFYYNHCINNSKTIISYNVFSNQGKQYDVCCYSKNDSNVNRYIYICETNNIVERISGIKNFLDNICFDLIEKDLEKSAISTCSDVPRTFIDSIASATYIIDFPKLGYIVSRISLSEYSNSISSIFIAKVLSSFVPGIVANDNGLKYDRWKNHKGYVHLKVQEAFDANEEDGPGMLYGAEPYLKDYWPNNTPSTVTISSSIDGGTTLGYSTKDGFSLGGNITYGYSKAITVSNPVVNAQLDNSGNMAMWSYTYDKNREWTYDQEANIMYEISRDGNEMDFGDVILKLDYYFQVDRDGFYMKQNCYKTLELIARPLRNSIYEFNNGKI